MGRYSWAVFVVQAVCRGNVCRSPLAEYLLIRDFSSRGFRQDREFHVFSSGTAAYGGGARVSNGTWKELHRRGIDPTRHRSQQMTPEGLGASDLVITMEAVQSLDAGDMEPQARSRIFTLKELVAILESDRRGPWRGGGIEAVQMLDAARPRIRPGDVSYDIADPIGGSPRIFAACATQIDDLVGRVVKALWTPAVVEEAGVSPQSER